MIFGLKLLASDCMYVIGNCMYVIGDCITMTTVLNMVCIHAVLDKIFFNKNYW